MTKYKNKNQVKFQAWMVKNAGNIRMKISIKMLKDIWKYKI